jgi:hypothetical protein
MPRRTVHAVVLCCVLVDASWPVHWRAKMSGWFAATRCDAHKGPCCSDEMAGFCVSRGALPGSLARGLPGLSPRLNRKRHANPLAAFSPGCFPGVPGQPQSRRDFGFSSLQFPIVFQSPIAVTVTATVSPSIPHP